MVATSTQLLPDNHLHRIMPFNRFVATFKIAFLPLGVELNACRNTNFGLLFVSRSELACVADLMQ